jgi:hypothetical protein
MAESTLHHGPHAGIRCRQSRPAQPQTRRHPAARSAQESMVKVVRSSASKAARHQPKPAGIIIPILDNTEFRAILNQLFASGFAEIILPLASLLDP